MTAQMVAAAKSSIGRFRVNRAAPLVARQTTQRISR
jgi:hypothetical protein